MICEGAGRMLGEAEATTCPWRRLVQGPMADALTHVGQLALLRRLAGSAVKGKNYFKADIATGRVGPEQSAPRREFDQGTGASMNLKSVWAVVAGVLVVFAVTTLVDIALHVAGVYPPMDQAIDDGLALLATSYRIVIGIGAAWLTARLAPSRPMKHAMVLGCVGVILGLVGVVATWNLGMGPRWYPIALVLLAVPQSWIGGRIYEAQR